MARFAEQPADPAAMAKFLAESARLEASMPALLAQLDAEASKPLDLGPQLTHEELIKSLGPTPTNEEILELDLANAAKSREKAAGAVPGSKARVLLERLATIFEQHAKLMESILARERRNRSDHGAQSEPGA
jgi:hypothetical protein